MVKLGLSPAMVALGVAGVAIGLVLLNRGAAEKIGAGAVDAVDGIMTGAVLGIGERVGIPPTDETECERAIREGRTWDASFSCPAGRFLKYLAGGS